MSDAGLMAVFQIPHRLNQRRGKSNDNGFLPLGLTVAHNICKGRFMKKLQAKINKRFAAATLVAAAVVGLSALAMQASTQSQNALAPSLKSIRTDKATSFYANRAPNRTWFVECVLPETGESKAATENLKVITATL